LENSPDDFIVDTFDSGVTKEHGRIESRTATVIRLDALNRSREEKAKLANALMWLPSAKRWPDLKSVVKVERRRESTSSDEGSTDVRYFISSLAFSAEKLLRISIEHWTVETRAFHPRWGPGRGQVQDLPRERPGGSVHPEEAGRQPHLAADQAS
jgi:hypothetical protein